MNRFRLLFLIAILVVSIFIGTMPTLADASNNKRDELLQFTAGKHILGFKTDGMIIASGDHALVVDFIGSKQVKPESKTTATAASGKVAPLEQVHYKNLWDGISLTVEVKKPGIAESTWHIEPGVSAKKIRLQYNAPVRMTQDGGLEIAYETGKMTESKPIAWQEINGKRVPVSVAFIVSGENSVGFKVGKYDSRYPLLIDPTYAWHTFYGSDNATNNFRSLTVDISGNIYITGTSESWGIPLHAHSGGSGTDIIVLKLDRNGSLQWHTFYGTPTGDPSGFDFGQGIVVDSDGNIYVAGSSHGGWGAPLHEFSNVFEGPDMVVMKLDNNGVLLWHTFYGVPSAYAQAVDIALDNNGNIYVAGSIEASWGTPINPFSGVPNRGYSDIVVVKLDKSGSLLWHTFYGGPTGDWPGSITLDNNGNIYVAGTSSATWGNPINPYSGGFDIVVAKLDQNGTLLWNTFYGSPGGFDTARGITIDNEGKIYVVGASEATWGSPLNSHSGDFDALIMKLDSSGALQWHTFYGAAGNDQANGITIDNEGKIYVVGASEATWGSPLNSHSGDFDALIMKLDSSGAPQWHTFYGAANEMDYGWRIKADNSENMYIVGDSIDTWGSPLNPHSGGSYQDWDAFVLKLQVNSMHLQRTGQEACYNALGSPIPCVGSGQDGEYRAGVAWPNPRFTVKTAAPDNGESVTDNLTGLVWTKDANAPVGTTGCSGGGTAMTWQNALNYVACLNANNYLGHNDWRLPNRNELRSLINAQQANQATWLNASGGFWNPYTNVKSGSYWSSTTYALSIDNAWYVSMNYGYVYDGDKSLTFYVWPVHSGESGSFGNLVVSKTGQTTSYAAGDDGELETGATWPSPRFTDNSDGTITDNLTDLIWLKNANCTETVGGVAKSGIITWVNALTWSNNLASGNCGLTDGSSSGAWRLPNREEIKSLLNAGQSNPAIWLNTSGGFGNPFTNVESNYYWSSTTYAADTTRSWYVNMSHGDEPNDSKAASYYVWPVRGGSGLFGIPGIAAVPANKDFGCIDAGNLPSAQVFTVTNTGTNNLYINQLNKTGADATEFILQNDTCSNLKLAPNATCTFEAVFSSSSGGSKSANITFTSNATTSPSTVALTGFLIVKPILISPIDGAVTNLNPIFTWDNGDNPPPSSNYILSVCEDPDLNINCFALSGGASPGVKQYNFGTNRKPDTLYYWRVNFYGGSCGDISSDIRTFTTDGTAPVTTATSTGYTFGTWTNSGSVAVSLSADDGSGSGVAGGYPKYCVDTTDSCTPDSSGTSFNVTCASGSVCTKYVRYFSMDIAGNIEPVKGSIVKQDLQAPETSITSTPASLSTSTSASFTFSGDDGAGSGVASYQCQLDGGGFSTCTSPQNYTSLTQGSHIFEVRSIDVAGNTDSTPASYTWVIDITAPADGDLTPTPGNAQVVLHWTTATDSGSGLRATNTYKLVRNSRTLPLTPNVPSAQCTTGTQVYLGTALTATDTGVINGITYDYRLCAYDAAGNVSDGTTAYAKPYVSGKMARNIYPLLPEGWIVNAYTDGTGPYTVNLAVLKVSDQQPVPFADIQGMTANPLLIESNALVPDLTLVMDEIDRTAYILHDSSGQLHLSAVTNIRQKLTAPPPVLRTTPTSINFGTVIKGTTKNSAVTVTNTGGSPLHFISITTPSAPFTRISDTCTGAAIGPSGTCSIGIRFEPTAAMTYNSSFSITSDGGSATVTLQGTGSSGGGAGLGPR